MTKPLNVLVVEDNVINQKVVCKMLERLQIPSTIAVNGREAVELCSRQPFELIFMDIQMPEMDGLEATRAIRSADDHGHAPVIIALTANAMQGDRERCLQAGMDDYLAKPIKQQDIESMIVKWFPASGAMSEHTSGGSSVPPPVFIDPMRIEQIKEIGDQSLLKELLELYLTDLEQYIAGITTARSAENFRQIYEWSHKLKGSSANLGIDSVRDACIAMEGFAQQNDLSGVDGHFVKMQQMMTDVRNHITRTYL